MPRTTKVYRFNFHRIDSSAAQFLTNKNCNEKVDEYCAFVKVSLEANRHLFTGFFGRRSGVSSPMRSDGRYASIRVVDRPGLVVAAESGFDRTSRGRRHRSQPTQSRSFLAESGYDRHPVE